MASKLTVERFWAGNFALERHLHNIKPRVTKKLNSQIEPLSLSVAARVAFFRNDIPR